MATTADHLKKVEEEVVWTTLFRGILLIAFGFFALLWPGLTLTTLAFVFALYVVLVGLTNLVSSVGEMGQSQHWFFSFVIGLAEIAIGVYTLANPHMALTTLILVIGTIFVIRGVFEVIAGAFKENRTSKKKTLMLLMGLLSVVAGVVILLYPNSSSLAFSWVVGAYAFVTGGLAVALSLELRTLAGLGM